jgi:hypothetical protein
MPLDLERHRSLLALLDSLTRGRPDATREFVLRARNACASLPTRVLITSDPFPFYEQALKQTFAPTCVYAQVENDYDQDRVKRSSTSVVIGSRGQLDEILARSGDSKRPNTA